MSQLTKRDEVCSMCEAQPEDMLILTCRHNLCLDCATEVYNLNTKNDHIMCEICLSSTPLDSDTIVCLRSLSAKAINQNAIDSNTHYYENQNQGHQRLHYPPAPKSQYHPIKSSALSHIPEQPNVLRCEKHNEPLTYYCLQCNIYTICSQCMLLQHHRYHKVVTLKKASVQIKETIEKVGREKLRLKTLLEKDRESLIVRRQESQKQLQTNLFELKGVFDQIMRLVSRRYEQMKGLMSKQASRKLQIMDGAINQIQQKVRLIQETIQFQEQLIRLCSSSGQSMGSAYQMFDYYGSQIVVNSLNFQPSLPKYISEVEGEKIGNRQRWMEEMEEMLGRLGLSGVVEGEEGEVGWENINLMSGIGDEGDGGGVREMRKEWRQEGNVDGVGKEGVGGKKTLGRSQNINIIQNGELLVGQGYGMRGKRQGSNLIISKNFKSNHKTINSNNNNKTLNSNNNNKVLNNNNIVEGKKSTIQQIKRRARQNMNSRELSNSRKLQLSRSIQNATDILNKIQQRSLMKV